jgi:hypothetical protein
MQLEYELNNLYTEQVEFETLHSNLYNILENKDHYKYFQNINEEVIEEGWFSDMMDIAEVGLKTIATTPAWMKELGEWLFSLGVSGVSGMLVAKILSQILIFAVRKAIRKYQKEQNIRNDVKEMKFKQKMEKMENLSDSELLKMREEIEKKFDEKFPQAKKGYWSSVIEVVSNLLNSSVGTYGLGLGFAYLYYLVTGLPNYDEVYDKATKDMTRDDIIQGVGKSINKNIPMMSPLGL